MIKIQMVIRCTRLRPQLTTLVPYTKHEHMSVDNNHNNIDPQRVSERTETRRSHAAFLIATL